MFFFFKQKTAYEMRISDWSSDVCSSDLVVAAQVGEDVQHFGLHCRVQSGGRLVGDQEVRRFGQGDRQQHALQHPAAQLVRVSSVGPGGRSEERRVGKECEVSVDLGGRRILKKKNKLIYE